MLEKRKTKGSTGAQEEQGEGEEAYSVYSRGNSEYVVTPDNPQNQHKSAEYGQFRYEKSFKKICQIMYSYILML